jgi:diguanylate cyclase (GGDEF)-like protein
MKINDPVRPSNTQRATSRAAAASTSNTTSTQASAPVGDVVSVDSQGLLGIPAQELTPRVREALIGLMREVELLRQELEHTSARLAELEKLADTDTLTPIANRRAFVRELNRVMSYAERYQVPTALLFIDVNGLKEINDSFGHTAGDLCLIHVADVLRDNIRSSDVVGRLGGDEYAVILTHASEQQANSKAELLSEKISQTPVVFEAHAIRVQAAIGVYCFGPHEQLNDILARADANMYVRKRAMKEDARER